MNDSHNRKRGRLLGLAAGDAFGTAVEFQPSGPFEPVIGYRAGEPRGLAPGERAEEPVLNR